LDRALKDDTRVDAKSPAVAAYAQVNAAAELTTTQHKIIFGWRHVFRVPLAKLGAFAARIDPLDQFARFADRGLTFSR
jgi:hypothetical protein